MAEAVIALNGVAKRYRLRRGWQVTSLREEVGRLTGRLVGRSVSPREEFWALRDVTLAVHRGEVVGVVGVNGAGKSTLLKILSRVTVPTLGTFEARGRLGALIEIGAGFHPELSGRENIFLNGAIMGMSRREVAEKFERIVAFAEVERFLDTPIKHYSSGMQMRLGFAVAAHIEPEILLIDEILAVGDASFQAKCLNKLAELKEEKKTVLLVSHNLANIAEHSNRVVWLDQGAVRMTGEPGAVIEAYLEHLTTGVDEGRARDEHRREAKVGIVDVTVADEQERARTRFDRGERVLVDITYSAVEAAPGVVCQVSIHDAQGYPLGAVSTDPDAMKVRAPVERGVWRLRLDPLILNRGVYTLGVRVFDAATRRQYDMRRRAARLIVDGHRARSCEVQGYVHYPHRWEEVK